MKKNGAYVTSEKEEPVAVTVEGAGELFIYRSDATTVKGLIEGLFGKSRKSNGKKTPIWANAPTPKRKYTKREKQEPVAA